MNHLNHMTKNDIKSYNSLISQDYFTWTYFNEPLIQEAWKKIKDKNVSLNINLFKKQNNFTLTQSLNHNLILLLLYENIKTKEVFKYFSNLKNLNSKNIEKQNSLIIDNLEITQDDINSLFEYEQIEKLLNKLTSIKGTFLEVGAGSGRTAKAVLSIKNNVKYVIADIPPAINICLDSLRNTFPEKKIATGFKYNTSKDLNDLINKNDIILIFPHQIKLFSKKTFDITIAIDCLHEMEKKIIKNYMKTFEDVSSMIYFKVWEYSALPYSFYQHHSIHNKEDYSIKNHWKEHLKEKCVYPSNFFHLGYEF